jgi:hypothetical protein
MAFGTLSVADLLATVRAGQSVTDIGEDRTFEAISNYLAAHNAILNEELMGFVERTTERVEGVGGVDTMTMQELDEFGRADAQKVTAGDQLGFPLRLYGIALQWSRKWFENHTPQELVAQVDAAALADVLNVQTQMKRALLFSANYTFTDKLIDKMSIPVKRLVNADSFPIPPGPNGETFTASSHTHYLARVGGSLAASDVSALITTVAEHYNTGAIRLYINQAQEAAIRAMTSNFTAYVDARIITGSGTTVANGVLDQSNIYNRAIGVFDQAEVWVKPWVPANYLFAWVMGQTPPLVMRERRAGSGDFGLDYEDEQYPLRARQLGREFGMGVRNRLNGAVLYAGNTTYTNPSV